MWRFLDIVVHFVSLSLLMNQTIFSEAGSAREIRDSKDDIRPASKKQPRQEQVLGRLFEDFKKNAILSNSTNPQFYRVRSSIMLDNEIVSIEDQHLSPIKKSESTVFRARDRSHVALGRNVDKHDKILISKVNGRFIRALKIKKETRELIQFSPLTEDIYLAYSTSDINERELSKYSYGHDQTSPEDGRRLQAQSSRLGARSLQQACQEFTVIRIALAFDSGFCAMHRNDEESAKAYLRLIVATLNESYEIRGLCKRIAICMVNGFCKGIGGDDEFRRMVSSSSQVCTADDESGLLQKFRSYIYPHSTFPGKLPDGECDVAHLVYGRNSTGDNPIPGRTIGCAWRPSICGGYAVGVNYFGYTTNEALHAALLAHELGHNLNAAHLSKNDKTYIMESVVCPCSEFNAESVNTINDYVATRVGDTCTVTVPADVFSMPPSEAPSSKPSKTPSLRPSRTPSETPSETAPSHAPTLQPSSGPSAEPTVSPRKTFSPSSFPTSNPTRHDKSPSSLPSISPSLSPSIAPSISPSQNPSIAPSLSPSSSPSAGLRPSLFPSYGPTHLPSSSPSVDPIDNFSDTPSQSPTKEPCEGTDAVPSVNPIDRFSDTPSQSPSKGPHADTDTALNHGW